MINYDPLLDAYKNDCPGEHIVMLHPDETRPYTVDELINLRRRPFASRWYITGLNIDWTTVWLRTHFTDHAACEAPTRRLRDFVKATITTQNQSAAKSILADILTQWFEMEQTEYYSLGCMMASVLSEHGQGIKFETKLDDDDPVYMIKSVSKEEVARLRFTRLMDILFSKISSESFLVKDGGSNIFRLAFCLSQMNDFETNGDTSSCHHKIRLLIKSYGAAFIAILSQITLTVYVMLEVGSTALDTIEGREDDDGNKIEFANPAMAPLAILTLLLSGLFILPSIRNSTEIQQFYSQEKGSSNILAVMDYISNMVLPVVLAIFGFLVILIQGEGAYIEAVLNSTALLFILDIDDILPDLLNIDSTSVVRNHLIQAAVDELEEMRVQLQQEYSNREVSLIQKLNGRLSSKNIDKIQFSDLMLTNFACGGSDINDSRTFAPYEVKGDRTWPSISNSNYITSACLLRRVEWTYTTGYPLSSKPRIGLLRLWRLGDADDAEPYELREVGPRGDDLCKNSERTVPIEPHMEVMIEDPHSMSAEMYCDKIERIRDGYDKEQLKEDKNLRSSRNAELDKLNETYSVDGVYMITCFEMSDAIMRLRICGSKSAVHFSSAMQYYSLWDSDAGAERLLQRTPAPASDGGWVSGDDIAGVDLGPGAAASSPTPGNAIPA